MTPKELVDGCFIVGAQLAKKLKELEDLKAALIKLGPGKYQGSLGGEATVVHPKAAINPPPDKIADIKCALPARIFAKLFDRNQGFSIADGGIDLAKAKLKPELFKAIFTRNIWFNPAKGFRELAAALLPKKRAAVLITACEVEAKPYVKLTAPPPAPA